MHKEHFYFKKHIIADLYYRNDKEEEMEPFMDFPKEYRKLIDFFHVQPPKIKIQLIYSREEMDEHWGVKSQSWLQAMVDNDDPYLIYIFSPIVFERVAKRRKDEMLSTIVHETAHTFVSEINNRCFAWADEGICLFVEGEDVYGNEIEKDNWLWFKNNRVLINPEIKWSEQTEHQGYAIASNLVRYILKRFGKDAIFGILKI